jgi:nitroreductase
VYRDAERIDLPAPNHQGLPVETAIKMRRSVRNDSSGSLPLQELSQLLFVAQGTTGDRYGERGFRYVYIEAGHISQNIYLQAVSLGLGSVAVGAFLDEKLNTFIGVDGKNEAAIYLHAVGTLGDLSTLPSS